MSTWCVQVDFQGGAGWETITGGVIESSFVRRRQLWNKLSPTVNTLDFQLKTTEAALIAKFMTASKDVLVQVTKDDAAYFSGMVQPNYSVDVDSRIKPFDISCVDNGYRLKRRITANINWSNYKVCSPASPTTSILHQLMVAAGLTASAVYSSIVTIDKTIDRFVGIYDQNVVWDMLAGLLFDFGYTFYFRPDGTLDVFYFAQSSIITSKLFSSDAGDTRNIIGKLTVERNEQDYEAVRVNWSTHKTLTNVLLFSDTTNGDSMVKCNIEVASGAYWPTDANLRDMYADYNVSGYELIATSAVTLSIEKDAAIVQDTFTDEILRAKIKFHNSGAIPAYIRRFDIYGTAIVKDQYNVQTRIMSAGTNKYLDLESNYLYSAADASLLVDAVAQYYYNADMRYTLRSRTSYEPGDYVYVKETGWLNINNLCVVQEVADNEYTGEHTYVLEGAAEYSAGEPTSVGSTQPPEPPPPTSAGTVTVAASGYSGLADWYCDGTADEVQINSAILHVSTLYGGGVVRVLGGTFILAAAVEMLDGITLEVYPSATLEKNCDDYAIKAVGTSGTHKTNVTITGQGTITRNDTDIYWQHLIYFEYVDNSSIEGITITKSYYGGITMLNCKNVTMKSLMISLCQGWGLKTLQSIIIAVGLTISECGDGYECFPSDAIDKIYYGDCEWSDEPMLNNETTPVTSGCTWARSPDQPFMGGYSYKMTLTGTSGEVQINDSNVGMHGLIAGKTYLFAAWIYVPAGVNGNNVEMSISQNGSETKIIRRCKDWHLDYQYVGVIQRIASDTTQITGSFKMTGSANDYIHVDDIVVYEFDETDSGCQFLDSIVTDSGYSGIQIANSHAVIQNNQITGSVRPGIQIVAGYQNVVSGNRAYNNGDDTGIANDHQDNFYDAGTDTQNSDNSWNFMPVAGESSWGSPHTHLDTLVSNADPANTNDNTVTCSNVPTGTRGIYGWLSFSSSGGIRELYIKDSDGNIWVTARNIAAGASGKLAFIVPLNSSKQFLYAVNNADVSAVYIYQCAYFI